MWDESGYDLSDPKHPTYHDRYAGLWDLRDKVRHDPASVGHLQPDGETPIEEFLHPETRSVLALEEAFRVDTEPPTA